MGTWGELLQELNKLVERHPKGQGEQSPFDLLRRKYLKMLNKKTGRGTIVYATAWLEGVDGGGRSLSIVPGDVQGFMEAVSNITEKQLDLIVTSPGGSAEAAESIMGYLRTRFEHIRMIVPVSAMSAATMMALACDEIVMGDHSQLGPIDPQFTLNTPDGPRQAPGQAIVDQFEMAKIECQNPANIGAWLPLIRGLLPGLLAQCRNQRELAEEFAARSLEAHMFVGDRDAPAKAKAAAAWFADFSAFKSHGRRVSREDALAQGLNVTRLEDDNDLQDLVLSVHHAVRHTFSQTGTVKLIENHHGRAYIESQQRIVVGGPNGPPPDLAKMLRGQPPAQPGPAPFVLPPQPGGNRQQRRSK